MAKKNLKYFGRISSSGAFCGHCPLYKKECSGVSTRKKLWCEMNKQVELCCAKRSVDFCYNCSKYPCAKFKLLAKKWQPLGEDIKRNQKLIERLGSEQFKQLYNNAYMD